MASGRTPDEEDYLRSLRNQLGQVPQVNSSCRDDHRKSECQVQAALRIMREESSRRDWFCATEDKSYLNARNLLAALDHYNPDANLAYLAVCSRDQHPCEFFCLSRGALASFSPEVIAKADPDNTYDLWLSKMFTSFRISRRTSPCVLSEYSWFVKGGMVQSVPPRLFREIVDNAVVFPVDWINMNEIRDYHNERNADCASWPASSVLDDSYPCEITEVDQALGMCSLRWLTDVCEMDQPGAVFEFPYRDCLGYGLGDIAPPGPHDTDRYHPVYLELTQQGFCDFLKQNEVGGMHWEFAS